MFYEGALLFHLIQRVPYLCDFHLFPTYTIFCNFTSKWRRLSKVLYNLYNFRIMRFLQKPENALMRIPKSLYRSQTAYRKVSLVEQYTIDGKHLSYFCTKFFFIYIQTKILETFRELLRVDTSMFLKKI
jgi:hypothetical protein